MVCRRKSKSLKPARRRRDKKKKKDVAGAISQAQRSHKGRERIHASGRSLRLLMYQVQTNLQHRQG